jgi:hypothetical protein
MNNLSSAPARSAPGFVNCEHVRIAVQANILYRIHHQQRCNAS